MKRMLVAVLVVGCGGAMPSGECTKDTDCKGTRVCSLGACVEPGGSGGGSGTGGGSSGTGGGTSGTGGGTSGTGGGTSGTGGGTSGTGGGTNTPPACFGGRDSDCPAGYWCNMRQCVATTKAKVGEICTASSDCAGNACLYRNSGDTAGYCSKLCQSFGECPPFWNCEEIANAAGKFCVQ